LTLSDDNGVSLILTIPSEDISIVDDPPDDLPQDVLVTNYSVRIYIPGCKS